MSEKLTGQGTQHQRGLIKLLEAKGKPYWIRHVYLPGWSNAKDEYMIKLGKMIGNLKHMTKFEFLPYHVLAVAKYENMGWTYPLAGVEPPTTEQIADGMRLLKEGIDIVKKDPSKGEIVQYK